jgi:hypothetical protein
VCARARMRVQELMEAAGWLLNRAAAGEASWDDVRGEVAEKYKAAGCRDVAMFILS